MTPELDQEFGPGTLHALRAKVLVQACRRAFRRAGPRMWFLPFTNWRPMPSAMARGRDGCASGTWSGNCGCQVDDGDPPRSDDRAWDSAGSATSAADGHRQTLASSMSSTPGHGLWLVRQVADRMSMASGPGGTRVRVAFDLF